MPRTRSTAPTTAPRQPVEVAEAGHVGPAALAPEPGVRGRAHAGEHLVGAPLQRGQFDGRRAVAVAGGLTGRVTGDRLVEDVVRRRARHELAAAPHEQIAVAHAGVELEVPVAQRLLERREAGVRLVVREMAGGVVGQHAVGDGDEVAAVRHVVRREVDDVDRLERAAPAEDGRRVVARARRDWRRRCPAASRRGSCAPGRRRRRARDASMCGVCAASSGVRPPSAACGSSAMPSGTSSTRLGMGSLTRLSRPAPSAAARRARRTWAGTARCRSSARRRRPSWSRRPPRSAPSRSGRRPARPCGRSRP